MAIRTIMLYLDASDGNMEGGSLRVDANVSVRLRGETGLRPRIEIKNMNSFHFLEMAIQGEISRQIALYIANPHSKFEELIPAGTYRWDPELKQTILMRRKESADDYRYFPEPDLIPILLKEKDLDDLRATLPELAHDRFRRYMSDLNLSQSSAAALVSEKKLSDYFEEALKICKNPRALCNWIIVEFAGRLKEGSNTLLSVKIPPSHVAKLVQMIEEKRITGRIAKAVADEMIASPGVDPEAIVRQNPDYQPVADIAFIEPIVDQVLAENPQSVSDFLAGKDKAFAFLVGSVMKLTRGKATPQIVNELLRKKISRQTES
jgi:aspartyl-tRNA(Asn)/glutamyl-tRNA(Gln) amidotransferase subunit B